MLHLKELREKKGITQAELSKVLKISPSSIGMYEQGRREPDNTTLRKIANYFNVSIDYLLGNSQFPLSNEVAPPNTERRVPIIGTVKCGPDGFAYEYMDGYVAVDSSIHGEIRAFPCKGDSMRDLGIFDGDLAIVRIQDDVESGELAVVTINGNEGTLKRVRKQPNAIVLEAANPKYPPRVFIGEDANTVHVVGKVIQVIKKF